ncbi:hypothetical protein AVHM3334_04110 [Acidovorax sp. SUPP3334]|nr:hypothetical protein AVHM3334_04110 [Acidovorax sp. SUPP3334]
MDTTATHPAHSATTFVATHAGDATFDLVESVEG